MALGVTLCGAAASAQAAERAKNVILFIGDGMGVSTLTAARIFEGQRRGVDGASNRLSFEAFPDLALVRTYSADSLVTESAASASAILTGRRTLNGALGVDNKVVRGDCASAKAARVPTLAELAKRSGRATGVVSTAAITDATPASLYAHTPSRQWQADADLPPEAVATGCVDIARQMLDGPAAMQLDVMLGGGLAAFTPVDGAGRRLDGRDLTAEWRNAGGVYVETGSALAAVPRATRRLLGLFAPGNMMRETTRRVSEADAPRLVDMTLKAIEILSNDPDGYFLMVEGGLIDKAHHQGLAYEALNEVAELSEAVAAAAARTDAADTLILVTADHSHGLTLSGGGRGTSVLGLLPGHRGRPGHRPGRKAGVDSDVRHRSRSPGDGRGPPRPDQDRHRRPGSADAGGGAAQQRRPYRRGHRRLRARTRLRPPARPDGPSGRVPGDARSPGSSGQLGGDRRLAHVRRACGLKEGFDLFERRQAAAHVLIRVQRKRSYYGTRDTVMSATPGARRRAWRP
ncbi:MAG: alkaline phosphatase [Phenylobacterium sp.]|nr:alkaline phosphatase [Phenylobacterium sp.]MDP3854197.1 alkaline phosphatase [Phenylobacterium sp.]